MESMTPLHERRRADIVATIPARYDPVVHAVVPSAIGLSVLASGMAFFLTYEWLHLAYHLPPTSAIGRMGFVSRLREICVTRKIGCFCAGDGLRRGGFNRIERPTEQTN